MKGARAGSSPPRRSPSSAPPLFDHNRIPDILGSYELTPTNNWTIGDDAAACPGASPASTLSLGFAAGWSNTVSGSLAPEGKIDVTYDIQRLPQDLSCSTDGVLAFATVGYVQFQPGGQVLDELVAPFASTPGGYSSVPLEFDVPAGTQSASLWFESTSDCGGTYWDSDYGQNYDFAVP